MADAKKSNNNVGGTIGMVIGLVSAAAPIITAALDKLPAKDKSTKASEPLAVVPDLYTKGFPLTLEQAKEKLSSEGFGVIASEMTVSNAKPKYKDCIDTQVVDSRPRSGEKTKPGTTVIVRYVTQEVIDESRRLFTELETQKAELRAQKSASRQEKIEQTKQLAVDVVGKTKSGVEKIFTRQGRKEKEHE